MMKVWIASYPRSGNTFLRLILNQAFGIKSTSEYSSEDVGMRQRPWLMDRIGYAGSLETAEHEGKWLGVKTHGTLTEDAPAIYVVRDGRAAVVSYFHMLQDYTEQTPTISDIIEGRVWPGSWSAHYRAWHPENRPRTLLLRYEEMKANPASSCEKIAKFLQIDQKRSFEQCFDELNALEPTLFRVADDGKNITELGDHLAEFDNRHATLMRELHYY